MSATVLPLCPYARAQRVRRQAAVRASLNARAAFLGVSESIRERWVDQAMTHLREGATMNWAIADALRGMMGEHRKEKLGA